MQIHWRCWDGLEAECLVRSRELTRSRVILECPLGWQWYLGDRVTRQSLGLPVFVVPGPLPPRVQRTNTYMRAELERFTVPDNNLDGLLRRTMDYGAYKERYLAMSLGVEQELERRVAEAAASRARVDVGGERGRGGQSQRGRGAISRGRGRGGAAVLERVKEVALGFQRQLGGVVKEFQRLLGCPTYDGKSIREIKQAPA